MRYAGLATVVVLCAMARAAHAEPPQTLVDQVHGLIGAMPFVEVVRGKSVVIVEGPVGNGLLSFRQLDRAKMRDAVRAALTRHGIKTADAILTARDPMAMPGMIGAADGGLMFEVDTDGTDLEVTLYTFHRPRMLYMHAGVVDGHGAVAWNATKLSTLALILLAGAGIVLFVRHRRRRALEELESPTISLPAPTPVPAVRPTPLPAPAPSPAPADDSIPLTPGALAMMSSGGDIELELSGPLPPPRTRPGTAQTATVQGGAQRPSQPPEKILGRYRIVGELGRGAMGVVYRAYDENLEREVAVKVMSETMLDHADALRLFASEAKALAQLNHQNIVAIYDQFAERGKSYLIMELVDGITLDRVLREQGPYAWSDALRIAYRLCNGLAYAHGRNVVHRDIKPANIFLTSDGDVKLGDFGLARVLREVAIRSTEVRGTPLYMAPEQVTGTNIDHRADLYAVGCTLFELVTGRPPFISGEIMYQQVTAPPPSPSSIVPAIPADVDRLILALLAKSADERPATAQDVRTAIRAIAG